MEGNNAKQYAKDLVKNLNGLVGELDSMVKKTMEKMPPEKALEMADLMAKANLSQNIGNISKDLAKMKDALKDL